MNNPFLLALKRTFVAGAHVEAIEYWRMFEQRFLTQSCEQKSMRQSRMSIFELIEGRSRR
jgi:hypothetical protein